VVWLERGESTPNPNQECPPRFHLNRQGQHLMTIMIGVDPHKATHTAVAIDRDEQVAPGERRDYFATISTGWRMARTRVD